MQTTTGAGVAVLATGLLPMSAYNGTNGMENGIFALLVALWIWAAMRTGWFKALSLRGRPHGSKLALGGLLGLVCWLRPEGRHILGPFVPMENFHLNDR